jgi:GntR family transcriptional regulator
VTDNASQQLQSGLTHRDRSHHIQTTVDKIAKNQSPAALYLSVARTLKEELIKGVYPVGSLLPTEAALSTRFAVSRQTVRGALRLLRDEQLVATRQGAGTVVVPPTSADSFVLDAMSINELLAYAAHTHTEILSTQMELIRGRQAARIGVTSADEWLVLRGLSHADGSALPISWSEYYINRAYAGVSRLLQRHSGPILLLIEDMFALRVVDIDQEISATVIAPDLAASLKLKPGEAALEIRRTFRTADEQVVQIAIHTHPTSRFRHRMRIRRN